MKKKTLLIPMAFLLTVSLIATGCPAPPEEVAPAPEVIKYEWKMVSEELEGDYMTYWSHEFADEMYEWSDGQIEITVYPFGALGEITDMIFATQMGVIEFAMGDYAWVSAFVPQVQVLTLHYLWPKEKTVEVVAEVVTNGLVIDLLREKFREKGFEPFTYLHEGWHWLSSNKPIRTPEDAGGVKFRVMGTELLIRGYAALGFDAMTLPFGEVYGGLQTGLIDGQTQPMSSHYFMAFYEQQDYFTNMWIEMFVAIPFANRGFFDVLPEDIQNKMHEVWADFLLPSGYDSVEREQEYMSIIKEERPVITFYEFTAEETEPFRELALPVRDIYLEIGGEGAQEILDTLLADIEAAKAKLGVE